MHDLIRAAIVSRPRAGTATVKVWDAKTGALRHSLEGHTNFVDRAEFSADGEIVATASWDGTAKLWEVENGRLLASFRATSILMTYAAQLSADGRRLLTVGAEHVARIWDTHLETRTVDEIAAILDKRNQWRLADEALIPTDQRAANYLRPFIERRPQP